MTESTQIQLNQTIHLKTDFESAIQRVTAALKSEGFGVLTEIDVKETFKKKLDVDFRPYKILGACNPPLAHRALSTAPQAGLLLPCNVVVAQGNDDSIDVSIIDPISMLGVLNYPELEPVAQEASSRLERVLIALQDN